MQITNLLEYTTRAELRLWHWLMLGFCQFKSVADENNSVHIQAILIPHPLVLVSHHRLSLCFLYSCWLWMKK